jgi:DNA-binding transcriptional MerR regulator
MSEGKTLAELSELSGIPARTIRFYIARGLLEGPVKARRAAVYTADHVARLEKIRRLQADGLTLVEIAGALHEGRKARQAAIPASLWWQHQVDDDVAVWVRSDANPWRMKQIRAAIDEMAARLRPAPGTGRNRE